MKYSAVSIKPSPEGKWEVSFWDLDGDREPSEAEPNPNGWFYYPRAMGQKEAFELLRRCMVKAHRDEIESLEESKKSLLQLSMEKKPAKPAKKRGRKTGVHIALGCNFWEVKLGNKTVADGFRCKKEAEDHVEFLKKGGGEP